MFCTNAFRSFKSIEELSRHENVAHDASNRDSKDKTECERRLIQTLMTNPED